MGFSDLDGYITMIKRILKQITIIGGGLAGCEQLFSLHKTVSKVTLYEMRPLRFTEAHQTEYLAELVCSNSLKSQRLDTLPDS
jgi:methylenetetrahydrofolate--tRNA-(uracil-5-)-methyltransferase